MLHLFKQNVNTFSTKDCNTVVCYANPLLMFIAVTDTVRSLLMIEAAAIESPGAHVVYQYFEVIIN